MTGPSDLTVCLGRSVEREELLPCCLLRCLQTSCVGSERLPALVQRFHGRTCPLQCDGALQLRALCCKERLLRQSELMLRRPNEEGARDEPHQYRHERQCGVDEQPPAAHTNEESVKLP